MNPKRVYLAVGLAAVVVYIGSLWNGFTGDDLELITYNELVHSWSGVWRAFVNPYWQQAAGGQLYRPLTVATFALDWQLDGPALFHAVNVVWHAAVSLFVTALLHRWCGLAAALVGGVLFAVHPVHVEAVAGVVGRSELMAAAFTLLAVYAAVERRSLVWSTVWWIVGLLCKENAAVAPAIIAAAWALGFARPPRERIATFGVTWLVAGVGYALLRDSVLHAYPSIVAPGLVGQTPGDVKLTAIAALRDVTRLLVFPLKLRADYSPAERTIVTSMLDGRFVAGVIALAAWVVWLVVARRRSRPVEAMGLLWIALAYAPVSNLLFPIGVLIAERTLYLPSVGLALAVGGFAADLRGRALAALVVVIAVLGGLRSALRVPVWRTEDTLIQSIVRDSPHSYVGFLLSASTFLVDREEDKALQAAQIAGRLVPTDARNFIVGGHAALKLGKDSLAAELLTQADKACRDCLSYYQIEADLARRLGDDAIADSLLAHAERVHQR